MFKGYDIWLLGSKRASGALIDRGVLHFFPSRCSVAGENASPKSLRIKPCTSVNVNSLAFFRDKEAL